jgi:hypothetical protein
VFIGNMARGLVQGTLRIRGGAMENV